MPEVVDPPKPNGDGDIEARLKALEDQNSRLLDESRSYKKRAQDAEGQLAEQAKAKLEEEGKYKERLDTEIAEKQKLSDKLKSTQKSVLNERLRTEALRLAPDVHDVDDLLRQAEHRSLLQIDEDGLSVSGVEEYVKKVRESKPYLFKKSALPTTENTRPKPGTIDDSGNVNEEFMKELRGTKTQKELDAVLAKYGKK